MAELAVKFVTMVEAEREVQPMREFFQQRAADFEALEVVEDKVVGEHFLIWTEHHNAYTALVEEKLGVHDFCRDNSCDEEELLESMRALVREKPDV